MEVMKLAGRLGAAPCSRRVPPASTEHDAAVTSGGRAFDKLTERVEYFRHGMAAGHHFQHPLFTGEERFSPFLFVDISRQRIPQDDTPFRSRKGKPRV